MNTVNSRTVPLSTNRIGRLRSLHFWHRTAGVVSALFVILLVSTGLLLNHTGDLRLDRRYIQSPALLDLYGIHAPDLEGFRVTEHWLSRVGDKLYLDDVALSESVAELIGAVELDDYFVIAIPGQLLVVDRQGDLREKLSGVDGVPAGIRRIGLSPTSGLIISGAHGDYVADLERLEWRELSVPDVEWAEPSPLSGPLRQRLLAAYRGTGLPMERVLLDLHSGRILGAGGVYLVDAMACLFLLLAISGVWMWARRQVK